MGGSEEIATAVAETEEEDRSALAICLVSGGMDSCVTAAIANNEVTVSTVHHHRVETQEATIAGAADHTLLNRATAFGKEAIDDFHLGDKALRIYDEVGFTAVIVDGKLA